MSNTKVYQGQNFIDKVLESTGSTENAFEMAVLNGVSLTDTVAIGQELKATKVTRKAVVRFFSLNGKPASGEASAETNSFSDETQASGDGIGFMSVGGNFIVK